MLGDEFCDIVDDTCDGDQTTAVLALINVIIPFHDWKLIERNTPVEFCSLLVEFLLRLLYTTLFDFVRLECLEIVCKAELLRYPDEPFGWIVLMPFDSVSVV